MPPTAPDLSFERDGRPLHAWLLDLVSDDAAQRHRAGDAVHAMFHGLPSVHADLTDIEPWWSDLDHQSRWRSAVTAALDQPDYPTRDVLLRAAVLVTAAQNAYLRDAFSSDPQYDRILDRLTERMKADTSSENHAHQLRLMCTALCASIERDSKRSAGQLPEAFRSSNMMLTQVIEASGAHILIAPEAVWLLLDTRGCESFALSALRTAGTAAAPMFLPVLVEHFTGETKGFYVDPQTLASVGRDDPQLYRLMIDLIEHGESRLVWNAGHVLHHIGPSAGKTPDLLILLMSLTLDADPSRRGAAGFALGGITQGSDVAVDRLISLTDDHDPQVQAAAIEALGHLGRQSDRVVPRLVELISEFEEFDPDWSYHGPAARICTALATFGPAAAPAVDRLIGLLNDDAEESTLPRTILELLGAIGPAAAAALPTLYSRFQPEPWDVSQGPPHRTVDLVAWTIARIEGRL